MIDYLHGVELTPLRKLLFTGALAGGKEVEDTASGNPLKFVTDIAKPLKSLVASFTPVQAGTGDPSPENVRPITGMDGVRVCQLPQNLLSINRSGSQETQGITYTTIKDGNNKAVAVHVEGTRTGNNPFFNLNYVNGTTISVSVGEYKMYGGVPGCRLQLFYKDENGVERIGGQDFGEGTTATVPEGSTASWMRLLVDTDSPVDFVVYPVLIGISDAYAEISVEFPAMGKNLLDPSTLEQGGIDSNGTETYNLKRIRTGYIPVKESTHYVLSAGNNYKLFMHFYDSEKRSIGANTMPKTESPSGACYVRGIIGYQDDADIVPSDLTTGQIEENTSATTYEPFTNTIYGGTLDIVSGVLTATFMQKVSDGSIADDWSFGESGSLYRAIMAVTKFDNPPKASSTANLRTNYLKNASDQQACNAFIGSTSNFLCFVPDGITTKEDWLAYLAEHNLQIVYELETPVTYQLTPQQITALIGNNTIWSDADDLSVTYLKKG